MEDSGKGEADFKTFNHVLLLWFRLEIPFFFLQAQAAEGELKKYGQLMDDLADRLGKGLKHKQVRENRDWNTLENKPILQLF